MLCTCAHDWDEHERDVNPEKELPVRRDACAGGVTYRGQQEDPGGRGDLPKQPSLEWRGLLWTAALLARMLPASLNVLALIGTLH